MASKKLNLVGNIDSNIFKEHSIYNCDSKIYSSINIHSHTFKHSKEFKNIDTYYKVINNIEYIIKNNIFVYYDCIRKSLLYYSLIDNEYVCLVVKLIENKYNYVATIYPVSKYKIEKMRRRENSKINV